MTSRSQTHKSTISIVEINYLSNDLFDTNWMLKTKSILIKLFEDLHIYQFLKLVFTYPKTKKYIANDIELINVCIERSSKAIEELMIIYLRNAPAYIHQTVSKSSYNEDIEAQTIVCKYILHTHKDNVFLEEFKSLIHYRSLLDIMRQ
jgi:hypothetical protein